MKKGLRLPPCEADTGLEQTLGGTNRHPLAEA